MAQTKDRSKSYGKRLIDDIRHQPMIYLMALPVIAFYIIFHYIPMYGITMAFENYTIHLGIMGSEWVGLEHFISFFKSYYFGTLLTNTLLISLYDLIFGFPAPLILALLINELSGEKFKKVVQTISYVPHFISIVVICGIINLFTSSTGLFNDIVAFFGGERSDMLSRPELFRTIYTASGVWQGIGFGSIIYLAALSGVDPELYDAARIDGAGRFRQTLSITLPSILPTVTILLILRIGSLLSVGYEKIILLYNPITYTTADVISSFVYRKGVLDASYSYSTAIGLFNSIINFVLLVVANYASRKISETSLW